MICIDNSEWMRNGDYSPSRFQAKADAVNLICGSKTQAVAAKFGSFNWDYWGSIALLIGCYIFWLSVLISVLQSNPENTVGVLTMAGNGVRVLVTPTSDLGKILACMHGRIFLFGRERLIV